ncbi:MAG: hypothetical protein OEY91_14925 [Nitrospirota bacterium]|nr:hypothetical protein [Nitrospirota bacterium]
MKTEQPACKQSDESQRVRRFTHLVTIGLILACNVLLLLGLWVSGVDLEAALAKPELFDPANGACVGVEWTKVKGADGLVKVCTEWIDFSDLSGQTHRLPPGRVLAMGADGNLYFQGQSVENYRLIALMIFAIVVMASGMWLKRRLITTYQVRLQSFDHPST